MQLQLTSHYLKTMACFLVCVCVFGKLDALRDAFGDTPYILLNNSQITIIPEQQFYRTLNTDDPGQGWVWRAAANHSILLINVIHTPATGSQPCVMKVNITDLGGMVEIGTNEVE